MRLAGAGKVYHGMCKHLPERRNPTLQRRLIMQRIGIIDLGSNTVRLVVFDVERHFGRRLRPHEFREVLNEKTVAGLSAYVVDGVFTSAGIKRAVGALEDHLVSARNVGCKQMYVFATAVLRNCSNSKQAVREIERATGLSISIITGEEEAHLGFVGASITQPLEDGLLVDIGGGSTELTRIEDGRDVANTSIPQGSVSSYARYVSLVFPTPSEREAIREAFATQLGNAPQLGRNLQAYGVGGGVRAVAKMVGCMAGREKAVKQLAPESVASVLALLDRDPSQFAHLAVKAAPDRLHSLVPSAIILQECLAAVGAESLATCKYGLREGYLLERVLS